MTTLISTKLSMPTIRQDIILRQRLIDQLDKGIACKLTSASAPAGFGKTTVVNSCIPQEGHPVVRLSLDEKDNEP